MEVDKKDIQENSVTAALAYVWVLCFLPLFLKRKSKFAQFHAKQGLLLFAVEILLGWFFPVPVIGWALAILVMAFAIMGIFNALNGNYWEMPILGQYAKKIKF